MPNIIQYPIKEIPTKKWGLKHEFSIYPEYNDNDDWTSQCNNFLAEGATWFPQAAFSEANRAALKPYVEPWMRLIVEIGVSRDGWEFSSTKVLLDNKHPDCRWVGIDIEDRNWVCENSTNCTFIKNSSWDVEANLSRILEQGHKYIDLLFIDGDHSVNSVLKEWDYAKLINPEGGVVFLHDTNFHPGPWCLCESVDTNLFTVEKMCETRGDWGVAALRRK